MPPRSVSSAFVLVSLSALTAIEAGGCDKRLESLGSATRSALPMLALAPGSEPMEMNYAMADYGLGPHPTLKHICGHYELRADGKLTSWDLFAGPGDPGRLRNEVNRELSDTSGHLPARGAKSKSDISAVVAGASAFAWPKNCPQSLAPKAECVLVATRVL